jgi:hypothetical protein
VIFCVLNEKPRLDQPGFNLFGFFSAFRAAAFFRPGFAGGAAPNLAATASLVAFAHNSSN